MDYLKEPGQGVMDIKEATDLCSDFYAMDVKKNSVSTSISVHHKSMGKMKNMSCGNLLFAVPHSYFNIPGWNC